MVRLCLSIPNLSSMVSMPRNRKTLMQFDLQCLLEPQLWYAIIMIPSWWGRETERRQRAREWRLLRALTTGLLQRQWRLLVLSGAKVDRSSTRCARRSEDDLEPWLGPAIPQSIARS